MAIIIICIIIGFINYCCDGSFFWWLGIGLAIYFFIGGAIGCGLATNEVVEEQKIYALNDSSSIYDTYYLFSGYKNEEMVYRYVIDTDKGKCVKEVSAGRAYIKEGDYMPVVKHHYYIFEKKWHSWFSHRLFTEDYYVFCVPENTIMKEYNVDLN